MSRVSLIVLFVTSLLAFAPRNVQAEPSQVWPIEREIAESPVEIGIGYSARGYWQWRIKGTADSFLPDEFTYELYHKFLLVADGGKVTHNHPGLPGHCTTLSYDDVAMAAFWHLSEIRAVGFERGKVYVASIHNPAKPPSQDVYNKEHAKQAKDTKAGGWCTADNRTWLALGYDLELING